MQKPKQKSNPKIKQAVPEEKIPAEQKHPEGVIPVYASNGKEVDAITLDKKVFTGKVNKGVLHQTIVMYNANKRHGTASTKTISEVRGGGKKPWRQKGTGRARAGTIRSPLWRGGGVVFGPHPRDHRYKVPHKIRKAALLSSINSKIVEHKIMGIDGLSITEPKTKHFKAVVDALKLKDKTLFILDEITDILKKASRNLQDVDLIHVNDCNALDIMKHDTIVVTRKALEGLKERVKL